MIFRRGLPFGQGALHEDVNRAAIFRVHADHPAVLGGLQHGLENRRVVQHEHAGIGHENCERRNAFADQRAHFFQLRIAQVRDDAVECVVGHGLALGFFHPGVEGVAQRLAFVLNGEIDQRGRTAKGRRARPGLEIVRAGRAAERHVQVRVHVDAAGDDDAARGVNEFCGVLNGETLGDGGNLSARDADVRRVCIRSGDDRAAANDCVETHCFPPSSPD